MLSAAHELPDGDLVRRTREGDPEAFAALVQRHQSAVFNVCYRLLGERTTAEDLAQEAFIRAYARLDLFDAARPFGPWIKRVAANLCLNHLARPPQPVGPLEDETAAPLNEPTAALQDPARLAEANQAAEAVRAAIRALPPRFRAVIELRHFQDLSYTEMADALGRPLSDVKSDLFRARRLLAQALKQPEPHAD